MSWTHTQIKSYESEILHKYMHLREMQKVQRESICCFPVWRGKVFLSSPEEGTGTASTQLTPNPRARLWLLFFMSLWFEALKYSQYNNTAMGQNFLYWLSSQRWENSAVNAVPNLMLCLNLRQGIMYSLFKFKDFNLNFVPMSTRDCVAYLASISVSLHPSHCKIGNLINPELLPFIHLALVAGNPLDQKN